jgi:DNA-binding CsgD family transcriptional regulator
MKKTASQRNPFGLTFRECEVIEELIRLGSPKVVAASEGLNPKTVRNLMRSAVQKIGVQTPLQAAVMFDRKRRESVELRDVTAANSVFALAGLGG